MSKFFSKFATAIADMSGKAGAFVLAFLLVLVLGGLWPLLRFQRHLGTSTTIITRSADDAFEFLIKYSSLQLLFTDVHTGGWAQGMNATHYSFAKEEGGHEASQSPVPSAAQRSEIWDRWQAGESIKSIGRVIEDRHRYTRSSRRPVGYAQPSGGARRRHSVWMSARKVACPPSGRLPAETVWRPPMIIRRSASL